LKTKGPGPEKRKWLVHLNYIGVSLTKWDIILTFISIFIFYKFHKISSQPMIYFYPQDIKASRTDQAIHMGKQLILLMRLGWDFMEFVKCIKTNITYTPQCSR
jgi:hypothetical protein